MQKPKNIQMTLILAQSDTQRCTFQIRFML